MRELTVRELAVLPFQGSVAVSAGLLTARQLRGPGWHRLYPDVYVAADIALTHRMRCEAAMIALGSDGAMAISGASAAFVLGVDLLPLGADEVVEVTVPHGVRIRTRGLSVVRSRLATAELDPHVRFPVTGPERTAYDLARRLPRPDAVAALDAMLHRRVTTVERIRTFALGHPHLRGRPFVFDRLAEVDGRAESRMESVTRIVVVDAGLPRPEPQLKVFDVNGRFIGRLDLAYPWARIGIEYEGDGHRDRAVFRRDLARINAFQAAGWLIIRVTADDIRNPGRMIAQIRTALAERSC